MDVIGKGGSYIIVLFFFVLPIEFRCENIYGTQPVCGRVVTFLIHLDLGYSRYDLQNLHVKETHSFPSLCFSDRNRIKYLFIVKIYDI